MWMWTCCYLDEHHREMFKRILPTNALHQTRKVQQRRAAIAARHVVKKAKGIKRRDKTIVTVTWR